MKTGDKLIAIDPCVMQGYGTHALTVGKEYEVMGVGVDSFCIFDDDGDLHEFDLGDEQFNTYRKHWAHLFAN